MRQRKTDDGAPIIKQSHTHSSFAFAWSSSLIFALAYLAVCLFYFDTNQKTRPIWYDEVLTYYQVNDRSFIEFIDAFDSGVNTLPYLYFVFPWAINQFKELDPFLLRLPSLVFGWLVFVGCQLYLKRLFPSMIVAYSILATLLFTGEFTPFLAEARPYSLYVLLALIQVWATEKLLFEKSRIRWIINALIASLFASSHFVGLVYSGALLIIATVLWPRGWLFIWSSFVTGWAVFFAVHIQVLKVIFGGKSLSVPDWWPKPTVTNALLGLDSFMKVIPEVSSVLISLAVLGAVISVWCQPRIANADNPVLGGPTVDREALSYLAMVCIAWLLVPFALRLLASLGFYRLIVPRYFLPSMLGTVIGISMLIWKVGPFTNDRISLRYPRLDVSGAIVATILLFVFLLISLAKTILVQHRINKALAIEGQEYYGRRVLMPPTDEKPWFSVNSMDCFGFAYHFRNKNITNPVVIAKSSDDAKRWKKFAPDVNFIGPEEILDRKSPAMVVLENTENSDRYPIQRQDLEATGRSMKSVLTQNNWTLWEVSPK
jgi:hypothetical protein